METQVGRGEARLGPADPREGGSPQLEKAPQRTHSVLAGTRRLSSGVRLRCCPPMVTTEEPSWGRRAGESSGGHPAPTAVPESRAGLGTRPGSSPVPRAGVVLPSPAGPTCQLPQPHVHVLPPAFAAALSVDDHLVGSDTDLFGASCPLNLAPRHQACVGRGGARRPASSPCVMQRPGLGEKAVQVTGLPATSITMGAAHLPFGSTHVCPPYTHAPPVPL